MLKAVFLASLLAITVVEWSRAQPPPPVPPPPPRLAETFIAEYIIHRPGHVEFLNGKGSWFRNKEEGHFLSASSLQYRTHTVHREYIRLFDKGKGYQIAYDSFGRLLTCRNSTITEYPIPEAWTWLEDAEYVGYRDPLTNSTYNSWILQTWSGSLELVAVEDKPYLFNQVGMAGDVERWEFIVFDPVTPPDGTFGIPLGCPQDPQPPPRVRKI